MRWGTPLVAALAALAGLAALPAEAQDGSRGKTAGVMLVSPQSGGSLSLAEAQRVKDLGANTAGITIYWRTTDDQNGVEREKVSIGDVDLRLSIRTARRAGLQVALHIMLHCPTCPTKWRGEIKPTNRPAFFASYRRMVVHYAAVAREEGVGTLYIGSELTGLQGDAQEWRRIAAETRKEFRGKLVYEANWDAWSGVTFWDAVDLAGVSAYFPLTTEPEPTVNHLKEAWHVPRPGWPAGESWFAQMATLARRSGKPVVFGEVGYRSRRGHTATPWESFEDGPYAPQLQANAYQALLETFEAQPWWTGVTWWEWRYPQSGGDIGFTPRDKPAERLLREWWAEGRRPQAGAVRPDGSLVVDDAGPAASPATATTRRGRASPSSPTAPPGTEAAPTVAGEVAATVELTPGRSAPRRVTGSQPVAESGTGPLSVLAGGLLLSVVLAGVRHRRRPPPSLG